MVKILTKLKEVNLQLVETIAEQQQNEDRLNLQLTRLRLMYDFVSALNAAQTINEIYQIALNFICPALRTSRAALMTSDTNYSLKYQESVSISEDFKQAIETFFADPLHRVELKARFFPRCAVFPSDLLLQTICQSENIGAWAVFPLEYENRHLGDIVAYFDAPRQFNDEEVQLMQTIVTYIAIAITRKQAEQALKESQQFIQRITDTTPNIIYIYDIEENRNVYCNQTIHHILGYTPLEIQAMGELFLSIVIHPDDLSKIKEHYASVRHKKFDDLFLLEYRMKDSHGKWKWFYSQETVFLCNPDGTVKQTIGAASDITELKEVENRLQASLAEKEVLLREIHHRVKNNLSVIDSLLSMQARYVSDIEALKSLSDSQRRIHTMSLIHEQLYHSHDVCKVDFCEYLQRLVVNLYSSSNFNTNQIELKLDLQPALLNIDTAISLGLIVNELLTNSFKHAFPDNLKGLIEVILHEDTNNEQHRLHLTIRDNGIGIPQNIDVSSTASLGLRLVKILTQQLRAKLDLSCDMGTSFHFVFDSSL
ncbi:MAG: sensor histidine kinase [Pseudanabaena sp.]|jgi:PAS domain S-box-containing protein|nr:PAS domain-containing protein [Pseudanabaena sp. M53BS1SP1A06MG]MCA6583571.1 PAS domain-containing protein [Pseudanabaena sp. M34BS1SP1A06MG]MCA6593610.1 PAS domain-containing protein [Pseudanabaena sp. M38BS1SP1A06MG]MCA6599326.1 PAS domain-containing protein [Pseudanabaena sp. M57BS1SP1A06MG]MCA6612555.1 PAS domain-containing protein [Pseudanabaena sp. M158S2SP1A06QC]MCA6622558.1 PAS domain-containing protein [Pseudanabaena sp. M165S2SP1A06QC]MCE2974768.1 PAS domain-containing protein [P